MSVHDLDDLFHGAFLGRLEMKVEFMDEQFQIRSKLVQFGHGMFSPDKRPFTVFVHFGRVPFQTQRRHFLLVTTQQLSKFMLLRLKVRQMIIHLLLSLRHMGHFQMQLRNVMRKLRDVAIKMHDGLGFRFELMGVFR